MVFRRRQTLVDPDLIDFRGGTIDGVDIGIRNPARGFFTEMFAKTRIGVGVRAVANAVIKIANSAISLSGTNQVGIDSSILGSSSGTSSLTGISNVLLTANAAYTVAVARNYRARDATVQGAAVITLQIGYDVDDLTSGAANYAYRGQVSDGADKFNLYLDGTAASYIAANVLLGTFTDGMTSGGSLAIAQDFAHRGTKFGMYNAAPIVKPTVIGNITTDSTLDKLLDKMVLLGAIIKSTTPVTKPSITGDRNGSAALGGLLTALAAVDLVTDTTTDVPTDITGSRGGNAALANLLIALAAKGLITDSTT